MNENVAAQRLNRMIIYVLLVIGSIIFFTPFMWLLCTSFKPIEQTMKIPITWLPRADYINYDYKELAAFDVILVKVLEGPKQGKEVLVASDEFRDGKVTFMDEKGTQSYGAEPVPYNTLYLRIQQSLEIAEHGYMVKVVEGPKQGLRLIIREEEYCDGKVRLEVQEADRIFSRDYRCDIIKPVKKGWVKVVEDVEKGKSYCQLFSKGRSRYFEKVISKRDVLWSCIPKSEITTRIEFRLENYKILWNTIPFFKYLKNTLFVAVVGTIAMTFSSALVAYGFSRIKWKGRDFFFAVSIATMMIPFPVTMVPLYTIFKTFGMIGTLKPLWVPTFFASAFNIFLLRQFFMTIPFELSEAAIVDGCNEFQIFYRIILPLSKPVLLVVGLFHFMYSWNDFMGPLIYLNKPETFTLSLGLQQFQSKSGGAEWHLIMAMSVLIILPVIVLFFFTQKTFIQGIALTGSKE
ncbi:MAG: carbohydrate ABC transporter permease [Candidatus Hydrogenedentota bacterium]